MSTGKVPVVYMQNSGEGNVINPVASLFNDKVYAIPCIFIIGWRGEPGLHDEPQHVYQGGITLDLLKVLLDGDKGEAYNISADDEGLTLGDYARYIAALAGKETVFDLVNIQQGASVAAYALLDCAKLKSLGWQPLYTVRQGLERAYKILSSEKTVY